VYYKVCKLRSSVYFYDRFLVPFEPLHYVIREQRVKGCL